MPNEKAHIDFDLAAKYLAGECTDAERKEFELWLQDDANRSEFEAIKQLWDFTPDEEITVDVDAAWAKVSDKTETDEDTKVISIDSGSSNRTYFAWAAGLAILIAVSATLWFNTSPEMLLMESGDALASLELSDGSSVLLQENSTLRYSEEFDGESRDVYLTGVGYFEVAKNEKQPFTVHTDVGDVRVVGTSFEVDARGEEEALTVEVAEGIVEVKIEEAEPARVLAGQELVVTKTKQIELNEDLVPGAFFWKDKTIKFKRTQLVEVVEILNDLLNANIVIESDSINHCELTATFKNDDIRTILDVIAATLNIQLEEREDGFALSGEGC